MTSYSYTSLIINVVLLLYVWRLSNKVKVLRRANKELLSTHLDDLKQEIKHMLDTSNEMYTIKFLREEKGMSLVDAKQFVDSVKKSTK